MRIFFGSCNLFLHLVTFSVCLHLLFVGLLMQCELAGREDVPVSQGLLTSLRVYSITILKKWSTLWFLHHASCFLFHASFPPTVQFKHISLLQNKREILWIWLESPLHWFPISCYFASSSVAILLVVVKYLKDFCFADFLRSVCLLVRHTRMQKI
jgi:hypothetical protein